MGPISPEMASVAKSVFHPIDTAMLTRIRRIVQRASRSRSSTPGSPPTGGGRLDDAGPLPHHIQIATSAMTAAPMNAQAYRP